MWKLSLVNWIGCAAPPLSHVAKSTIDSCKRKPQMFWPPHSKEMLSEKTMPPQETLEHHVLNKLYAGMYIIQFSMKYSCMLLLTKNALNHATSIMYYSCWQKMCPVCNNLQ